jgi:hypothetical protein
LLLVEKESEMQSRTGAVLVVTVVVAQALLNAGLVGYRSWQRQQVAHSDQRAKVQIAQLQSQLESRIDAKLKTVDKDVAAKVKSVDDLSVSCTALKKPVKQQHEISAHQLNYALEAVAQWGYANGQTTLAERLRTIQAYVDNDKYWDPTAAADGTDHD